MESSARKLLFVGEKPSITAARKKWRWEDGRLAAATLFDALKAAGIEPSACRFTNLFGDRVSNAEKASKTRLKEIQAAQSEGYVVVAMGQKVSRQLGIEHIPIRHPAARGAGRLREAYRAHVASALNGAA